MAMRAAILLLGFAVVGCDRDVDAPHAVRAPEAAPISALQVRDLLSPNIQPRDGNLFTTVTPDRCAGVAREVDPPFVFEADPVVTDGGHWESDDVNAVQIEEMVGVYPADYDARQALATAKDTIESCRDQPFTVTTMRGRNYEFTLLPPRDSGSDDIVLWSFAAADWACDSAFIAAHNAAIEISTCSPVNGYDVLSLAHDALNRINALANTTA